MGPEEGARAHLPGSHRGPAGREGVRRLLQRWSLTAKKGYGQHFLASERVVRAIVDRLSDCKGVLEIGPGIGVLTGPIGEVAEKLVAVELDERMKGILAEVAPKATVVMADALEADLPGILRGMPEPRCIVSNMPYNITGPLLGRVAECSGLIERAVLMMQKEVGERIVAREGKPERGALSVSMQLQFRIERVCDAKAAAFEPPPKVDSVVLEFVPRDKVARLDYVLSVVHAGFRQPRKTLQNNLSKAFDKERSTRAIAQAGLAANIRPHQLSNEQWLDLAGRL